MHCIYSMIFYPWSVWEWFGTRINRKDSRLEFGFDMWTTVAVARTWVFRGLGQFRSPHFSNPSPVKHTGCNVVFHLRRLTASDRLRKKPLFPASNISWQMMTSGTSFQWNSAHTGLFGRCHKMSQTQPLASKKHVRSFRTTIGLSSPNYSTRTIQNSSGSASFDL